MFIVNETYVVFKTLEFIFLGSSHSNETRNAIEDTHVGHTLNKKVWAHTLWKNTLCIPIFFGPYPKKGDGQSNIARIANAVQCHN